MTRRLVDVAQDCIVTENDCGTKNGFDCRAIIEGGEIIESLGDRILGRSALNDILSAEKDVIIVKAGQIIDEVAVDLIEKSGVDIIKIRSALTCESKVGICAACLLYTSPSPRD